MVFGLLTARGKIAVKEDYYKISCVILQSFVAITWYKKYGFGRSWH